MMLFVLYLYAQGASHAKVAAGNLVPGRKCYTITERVGGGVRCAHLHQDVRVVALDEVNERRDLRRLSLEQRVEQHEEQHEEQLHEQRALRS